MRKIICKCFELHCSNSFILGQFLSLNKCDEKHRDPNLEDRIFNQVRQLREKYDFSISDEQICQYIVDEKREDILELANSSKCLHARTL